MTPLVTGIYMQSIENIILHWSRSLAPSRTDTEKQLVHMAKRAKEEF